MRSLSVVLVALLAVVGCTASPTSPSFASSQHRSATVSSDPLVPPPAPSNLTVVVDSFTGKGSSALAWFTAQWTDNSGGTSWNYIGVARSGGIISGSIYTYYGNTSFRFSEPQGKWDFYVDSFWPSGPSLLYSPWIGPVRLIACARTNGACK